MDSIFGMVVGSLVPARSLGVVLLAGYAGCLVWLASG
jgi:hypothetical protein